MDEIRWEFYPRVAAQEHAREWILFLSKIQKAPKTIDAYARCLDDLIAFFEQAHLPLIEASRGDVAAYLDDLAHRANPKGRGNARAQAGGLSHATIQQRLTAARLWYEPSGSLRGSLATMNGMRFLKSFCERNRFAIKPWSSWHMKERYAAAS